MSTPAQPSRIPQPPSMLSPSPPGVNDANDWMRTSPLQHDLSGPKTPSERGAGRPLAKAPPLPPLSPSTTEDRVPLGPSRSPTISSARRPSLMERELTNVSSARAQTNSLSSSPSHHADSASLSQPIPTPRQMLSARASNSLQGGFYSPRFHTPGGLLSQGTPRRHSDPNAASFNAPNGKPRALHFQLGRIVGTGGFGVVYQAILSDGTVAAVKEMKLDTTNTRSIDREVETMSSLPPHPHCVRYFGSRHSRHHYYIIMEYISAGSIQSLRQQMGPFRESVFQRYAYMILLGLDHLHQHGIIHRDIKGANVLLDERGTPKIVDFGCCKNLNQMNSTLGGGGTPLWMAPEVCRGSTANEKTDVWSFGCLCLEMTNATGVPWGFPADTTIQGLAYAIACATQPPPIPDNLSPEAHNFIECCLQIDPEERLSIADLLDHPFFDVDCLENDGYDDDNALLTSRGGSLLKSSVRQRLHATEDEDEDATFMDSVVVNLRAINSSDSSDGGGDDADVPVHGRMDDLSTAAVVSSTTASKSPSAPRINPYGRYTGGLRLHSSSEAPGQLGNAAQNIGATPVGAMDAEPSFRLTNIATDSDDDGGNTEVGGGGWASSASPSLARPSLHDARRPVQHDPSSEGSSRGHLFDPKSPPHSESGFSTLDHVPAERLLAQGHTAAERRAGDPTHLSHASPLMEVHSEPLRIDATQRPDGSGDNERSLGTCDPCDTNTTRARYSVPSAVVQRSRRYVRDSDSDSDSDPDLPTGTEGTDDGDSECLPAGANSQRPVGQATRVAREDARRHQELVTDIYLHGNLPSALPTPEVSAANYGSPAVAPDKAGSTAKPGTAPLATTPSWLLRSGTDQRQPVDSVGSKSLWPGRVVEASSFPPRLGISGKEDAPPPPWRVPSAGRQSSRLSPGCSPVESRIDLPPGLIHVGPSSSSFKSGEEEACLSAGPLASGDGMVWLTGGTARVSKTPGTPGASRSAGPSGKTSTGHERSLSHSLSTFAQTGTSTTVPLSNEEWQAPQERNSRGEKKRSGVMAKLLRKN